MAKKYSRIVRKLTQTLAYWNVPTEFLSHAVSIATQNEECVTVHLVDIIDVALRGETIKKSEVEDLRNQAEESETWHEWFNWSTDRRIEDQIKINGLKNKLWAAEQEIHDLKCELGQRNEDFERVERVQDCEIERLYAQNLRQASTICDLLLNELPELPDPPACLNGFDALKWSAARAYEPNSGPY